MWRERTLKVLLALVGTLFVAAIYPMTMIVWRRTQPLYGDAMMLSLYFTLGILLVIAVPNPSAHRSLISFAAWSSFAHATVMAIMAARDAGERDLLTGSAILVAIGVPLLLLAPAKQPAARASAANA